MIKLVIGVILLAIAAVVLYLALREAATCTCNLPGCGGGCLRAGQRHQAALCRRGLLVPADR